VSDIIVVRQLADDLWQWRHADSRMGWRDDQIHSGDIETLSEALPRGSTPTWYFLSGEQVVTQQVTAEARERRHLAKLVPFQLEEQAIDPVDDLHFSLGPVREGKLAVAYTALSLLQEAVSQLEAAGCDVQRCTADFLMLERAPDSWTLCLDQERLLVHSGQGLGLAVELSLASAVLPALVERQQMPAQLELCAEDDAALDRLQALLPNSLTHDENLQVLRREGDFWDLIDFSALSELDFRTGALGRRLPLLRWWQEWRVPIIATAAAFVLAIGVTAGQYWQAQAEQEDILVQMRDLYRQVVPTAGEDIRDPERRLESLVAGLGGPQASSNLMRLLNQVAPSIGTTEGLSVSSFRYSQDNRELQLNLEAEDFSLLEALRTDIAERGLTAELLRVSAQGDIHQARMRVVEANQ
jgi:general secretion pathway protein L